MKAVVFKKICAALILALLAASAEAERVTATCTDVGCTLTAYYAPTVQPGDAVFVRLVVTSVKRSRKTAFAATIARTALFEADAKNGAKPLQSADCYLVNRGENAWAKQSDVLLGGLPLSSYLAPGLYALEVHVRPFGDGNETLRLPVTVAPKEFVHETIPLDTRNTAIKTDISADRKDQIRRLNAILEAHNDDAVYSTSAFVPPTPATRRTSFFADRRVYTYTGGGSSTSLHYGIDYGVPTGSEVCACGAGKVVLAEDRVSTGWSVCIEHLPGLYSLYYHMSKLDVSVGDMVEQGALIGLSGATGLATGPHLHWEVRLGMEAVNPDFFTRDFTFEEEMRQSAQKLRPTLRRASEARQNRS